jgi:hypothetical protein
MYMKQLCKNTPQPTVRHRLCSVQKTLRHLLTARNIPIQECKLEELGFVDTKYLISFARQELKGPMYNKVALTHQRPFP